MLCVRDLFQPAFASSEGTYWLNISDIALTSKGDAWVSVNAQIQARDSSLGGSVCLVNEAGYLSLVIPDFPVYRLWDGAQEHQEWLWVDTWPE